MTLKNSRKNLLILQKLGYESSKLIGSGQESTVYDVGNGKVVKIFNRGSFSELEERMYFYRKLSHFNLPFSFPLIESVKIINDQPVVIEKKLKGKELKKLLVQTRDKKLRINLLKAQLEPLIYTKGVIFENRKYGDVLGKEKLNSETWVKFYKKKVNYVINNNLEILTSEVSGLKKIKEDCFKRIEGLDNNIPKSLVHGDYWLPNILFEKDLVSAVIDFNDQTLVGDYRIDVASAVSFSENYVNEEEMQVLEYYAKSLFGEDIIYFINFYSIYYAFLFAGVSEQDPEVYKWAIKKLNNYWNLF